MTEREGLPHYLRPGLRLVFIGYNPSHYSAAAGHYYARAGNAFWRQLSESGLAGRAVGPTDDLVLMHEAGIGFTDLCSRPTVRADELTRDEFIAGSERLLADLVRYQPGFAVFSGRGIYQLFARHALGIPGPALTRRDYGEQPERVGVTRQFVIPSSSGLASKWHRLRLDWLRALGDRVAEELQGPKGDGATQSRAPGAVRLS